MRLGAGAGSWPPARTKSEAIAVAPSAPRTARNSRLRRLTSTRLENCFDIFGRREYTLSIMRRSLVILFAAGAAIFARPALAHHSFSATYLETQTQTIE